jgi:hypothetical protein
MMLTDRERERAFGIKFTAFVNKVRARTPLLFVTMWAKGDASMIMYAVSISYDCQEKRAIG